MGAVFVLPEAQRPNRSSKKRAYPIFSADDADLRKVRWRLDSKGYAVTSRNGRSFLAHRIVLSRKIGRELKRDELTDHRNRNKLDNRRSNVRAATAVQNGQNRGMSSANSSGHRGVCWHKVARKWVVLVRVNGKSNYGGLFIDINEAANKARQMRRDFGFWN